MPLRIVALLVGINILWAGSSLAAKNVLHAVPPMTLAFVRFSLAAVLMYGTALALKVDLRVSRRDWPVFWAMGVLGLTFTYLLTYAGIQRTTVSSAALLIAAEPVFLAVLSRLVWREPMSGPKIGGILAGLVGVWVIIALNPGDCRTPWAGVALGDGLIALGLLFEAGSSIVGKGLVVRYPAVTVMTYQMATGAIALFPFFLVEQTRLPHPTSLYLPLSAVGWLFYLVVPCTVFAYTVWFTILDKRQAGEMSVFLFIQPVVGALLGVLYFHDPLTQWTVIGAVLVCLAIGLINLRPAPLPPV